MGLARDGVKTLIHIFSKAAKVLKAFPAFELAVAFKSIPIFRNLQVTSELRDGGVLLVHPTLGARCDAGRCLLDAGRDLGLALG